MKGKGWRKNERRTIENEGKTKAKDKDWVKGKGWRKNKRRTMETEGKKKAGRKRERQRLGEREKDNGWAEDRKTKAGMQGERKIKIG